MKAKFDKAWSIFCEQQKADPKVIGIILSGSFIYGDIDKNSDIDIFIILAPDCDFRKRGNTWVNNVEIEYFKNPPQQIRSYFHKEKNSPHTAHMLANGQLVYHTDEVVIQLIEEAKILLDILPSPPKPFQIELAKYHLDDLYKDLEDSQLKDDELSVLLLKNQIINLSIDWFCKLHQIRRTKHKRLANQLAEIDAEMSELILLALSEDWRKNIAMLLLQEKMATLLGGKRTKEWMLKSPLDL